MSGHASLQHTAQCALEQAEMCPDTRPGHSAHRIQLRLAAATPSLWQDALVASAAGDGWAVLALLDGGEARVWNHSPRALTVGEPVALHPLYHVVLAGSTAFNVLMER